MVSAKEMFERDRLMALADPYEIWLDDLIDYYGKTPGRRAVLMHDVVLASRHGYGRPDDQTDFLVPLAKTDLPSIQDAYAEVLLLVIKRWRIAAQNQQRHAFTMMWRSSFEAMSQRDAAYTLRMLYRAERLINNPGMGTAYAEA